jgi:hypothetical protein
MTSAPEWLWLRIAKSSLCCGVCYWCLFFSWKETAWSFTTFHPNFSLLWMVSSVIASLVHFFSSGKKVLGITSIAPPTVLHFFSAGNKVLGHPPCARNFLLHWTVFDMMFTQQEEINVNDFFCSLSFSI